MDPSEIDIFATNRKNVFTPLEKKTFLEILKKYSAVVENKETDSTSLQAKHEAWSNVTKEYNLSPFAQKQASTKQLRKLWVNLKHRQKHTSSTPSAHSMPLNSNSDISILRLRHSILEKEYNDGQRRADELHDLELVLLNEKIREAKAKADLAELLISRERSSETMFLKREDVDE